MKHCPKCNSTKDDADFYREVKRPDGLSGWCKRCFSAHNKVMYLKNPGRTTDVVKPRKVAIKQRIEQERVVRYGSAVADIMELMDGVDGF